MTKIIAECGIAHGGSRQAAICLAAEACKAGADYVKFQMFNPAILSFTRGVPFKYEDCTLSDLSWKDVLGHIPVEKRMMSVFDAASAIRAISLGVPNLKLSHIEFRNVNLRNFVGMVAPNFFYSTTDKSYSLPNGMFAIDEYPTDPDKAMASISELAGLGWSDHCPAHCMEACDKAVRLNAPLIEIHVHENTCRGCADHNVSKSMSQLEQLCRKAHK